MNRQKKTISKKLIFRVVVFFVILVTFGGAFSAFNTINENYEPAEIKNGVIHNISDHGFVKSKLDKPVQLNSLQAPPKQTVEFLSKEIDTEKNNANAVILTWNQDGNEGVALEVRSKRNGRWTDWISALQEEDQKDDHTPGPASTLVLANEIDNFQYRFRLIGDSENPSGMIDLSSASLKTIDSSDGPKKLPTDKTILDKIGSKLKLINEVNAVADGPRIISRSEWGSPEPNGSPRWDPEYHKLGRAIVHHPVSTETPNALVAIRAIWDYHANHNGWGDIGYNYLVDSAGNIFQGRYFDQNHAFTNSVEVKGGHTYGHNDGTIGIAAIGNFQSNNVTSATLASLSNLIAFKFAPYRLNPSGNGPFNGPTVIGHRDHGSTACPGANLYNQIPTIRLWAAGKAGYYADFHEMDYRYVGQQVLLDGSPVSSGYIFKPGDDVELIIRLKNYGMLPWKNTGPMNIRLGTTAPHDRNSRFFGSGWLSKNRAASYEGKIVDGELVEADTVGFNEIAQFKIRLTIPEVVASQGNPAIQFKEFFNLVIDGKSWFPRDMGIHQSIGVQAGTYAWQYQGQGVYLDDSKITAVNPNQLSPGIKYYAELKAKNIGTATWQQASMRLGTVYPTDRRSEIFDTSWLGPNRPAAIDQGGVAPGEIASFGFWFKAPAEPKTLKEYFRPVADGVTWLNDLGQHFEITVVE